MKVNPALLLVKEVRETRDIKEVTATLAQGNWIVIAVIQDATGILYSMGRVAD